MKGEVSEVENCRIPRRLHVVLFTCVFLLGWLSLPGCGHLMHPNASEYLEQARGSSGIETLINLTSMMDASIQDARHPETYQDGLDTLHDQFHALQDAFCLVGESESGQPAFVKAATIRREMRTVFHRLWKYRADHTLREVHLDLFATRIRELQETLQAVKT